MTPGSLPALRHLDYGPGARIEDVGAAGLQTLLDDGDLADWRPILTSIRREPFGVVAGRVVRLLPHLSSYGTAAALDGWLCRCREGIPATSVGLAELRAARGVSQRQMAVLLGVSQPQVVRLEAARNPTVRSLRNYLTALGLEPLALLATDAQDTVVVRLPE